MGFFSLVSVPVSLFCILLAVPHADAAGGPQDFPLPLMRTLPYDVDVGQVRQLVHDGKIVEAQHEFDVLSWQAFLALNWPATQDGQPDGTKTIADVSAPRVWSFWRQANSVFQADGATPAPWNAAAQGGKGVVDITRTKAAWRQHATSADENFQAFSGPLVDQNGKWVRYDVRMNHEEFDYLVSNKLYNQDGQVAFSQRERDNAVSFPIDHPLLRRHGAIEIKLAWKELGPNDDHSRFFVQRVRGTLSEPAGPGQTYPLTREYDAGLVGMHIAMRTQSSPEWIWATFEQIDNVRANKTADGQLSHPNFFNPNSTAKPNVLPDKNATIDPATGMPVQAPAATATTWIESLTTQPVQVTRLTVKPQPGLNDLDDPLTSETATLNAAVQAILGKQNSVFAFYELVGTQWPLHPAAPAFAGGEGSAPDSIRQKTPGAMVPVFLVNTTMETYFQHGEQEAGALEQDDRLASGAPSIDSTKVVGTESCVGCHYSAGAAIGFKKDPGGNLAIDSETKKRVAIFGENGHFGDTGSANFSWLMQIESQSLPLNSAPSTTPAARAPAFLLDIKKLKAGLGAF